MRMCMPQSKIRKQDKTKTKTQMAAMCGQGAGSCTAVVASLP
jgi:hypothetical protein